MIHPSRIIDYNLYLSSAEREAERGLRCNSMFLFDGDECRPFFYREFREEQPLDPFHVGSQPKLLFGILPIANFADALPTFSGMSYILGFDYFSRTFFARFLDWVPADISDLWTVWDEGYDTYGLTILGLYQLLKSSLENMDGSMNIGVLSSSPHCLALHRHDDPGLEMVIAIRYCQWVVDFADAIFDHSEKEIGNIIGELSQYLVQCRLVLEKASNRAWFTPPDDLFKRRNRRQKLVKQCTNDLYNFHMSASDESFEDRDWHAPSIETCNRIREHNRRLVKEHAEKELENVFTEPAADARLESPDQTLGRMLERTTPNYESFLSTAMDGPPIPTPSPTLSPPNTPPRTPSPYPQQGSIKRGRINFSFDDEPEIIRPVAEAYDDEGVTEFHKIPIIETLHNTINLIRSHPELDTTENRTQLGAFLTKSGLGIKRKRDEVANRPSINWNVWEFGLMDEDPEAKPPRILLPSPMID